MPSLISGLHPGKNIRLFKSNALEKLSYVHPAVPAVLFVPTVAYLFFAMTEASPVHRLAALAGGLVFWTLTEYTLHRFVFHFHARSQWGKRIVYLFHGIHHDDPEDARRLVMPPVVSITLATAFFFLFRLGFVAALGDAATDAWFAPFYAGFLTGYLAYDYIHFWVHFGTPRTALGKGLKQYHMLHHFVTPDTRYGVSSPLWDIIVESSPFRPRQRLKGQKGA